METETTSRPNRVSYEDMANPRRYATVTECIETRWGIKFRIQWDDGGEEVTDMRQRGWSVER